VLTFHYRKELVKLIDCTSWWGLVVCVEHANVIQERGGGPETSLGIGIAVFGTTRGLFVVVGLLVRLERMCEENSYSCRSSPWSSFLNQDSQAWMQN
jgi:hypothetical protein